MLRAGRFRHRLLDEAFLHNCATQAHLSLQPFLALWRAGVLHDAEMAGLYIWIFSFLRRPQDFLGGAHPEFLPFDSTHSLFASKEALHLLMTTLPENLQQAKSLKRFEVESAFLEHLCRHSLRSIPLAVSRSLSEWQRGRYSLKLMTTIPSADEVLQMQCQGQRCVSMLVEQNEIENFVLEGRDVLGFIIHDLLHADHFFVDQENARAQIYFSQKMWEVRHSPHVVKMLQEDPQFQTEFHYLMSDMNSVPLHLLKSLKTIFLAYFKRRDGLAMTSCLGPDSEKEFESFFETLLKPWAFSKAALAASHRLNTPLYFGREDSVLLDRELRPKSTCYEAFSLSNPPASLLS